MDKFQCKTIFEIFGEPVHLKPLHAVNLQLLPNGKIPYVTRTAKNNGIEGYIEEVDDQYLNQGNAITFGAETGRFFYQEKPFISGNKMYALYNPEMNYESALFLIATMTKAFREQFTYGYGMIPSRIIDRKIPIPITNNEIDWKYMADIVRDTKKQLYKFPISRNKLEHSLKLSEREWKLFDIGGEHGILTISSGVRLTKENMMPGNIPFIGSTDSNNGITNWVSNINASLDKNVLGVNYNGSVVENFYHPYEAIFSDDVKRVHIRDKSINPTPAMYLFLKCAFLQHKSTYQYGFKFNSERMANQKLLLPCDSEGNPDWKFMNDYIRSLPNGDLI